MATDRRALDADEIDILNRIRCCQRFTMVPARLRPYVVPVMVLMHREAAMGPFWGVQFWITGATLLMLKELEEDDANT